MLLNSSDEAAQAAIERQLAAARRPDRPVVMRQSWRDLLFLHWRLDPEKIAATLPAGLRPDCFQGSAWLGVVPFFMRHVRPAFLPAVPWLSDFLELNLRTYVIGPDGTPGVWFYALDCNQPIAVEIARKFFHLPYQHATMHEAKGLGGWIHYDCVRSGSQKVSSFRYRPAGPTQAAIPGTLEFFLVERYVLYSKKSGQDRLHLGRVHHTPYSITKAAGRWQSATLAEEGFGFLPNQPDHALFSPGVAVEIFPLESVSD